MGTFAGFKQARLSIHRGRPDEALCCAGIALGQEVSATSSGIAREVVA